MKKSIHKITDLSFTLSAVNSAKLTALGEVSTSGWTEGELGTDRVGDGILHLDFSAKPPSGIVQEVITPISAERIIQLGSQPQDITVHSTSNEMSLTLPGAGDPK